jgi:hypothetical protein
MITLFDLATCAAPMAEAANPYVKAILDILPALTAVVGGLWVAWTYLDQQKKAQEQRNDQIEQENRARIFEAQKPFAERQLNTFLEAGKVAGYLAVYDKSKPGWAGTQEWKENITRFYQLFWTDLSIVEDDTTKHAMERFSKQLQIVVKNPDNSEEAIKLNDYSYKLATHIRASIQNTWRIDLGKLSQTTKDS